MIQLKNNPMKKIILLIVCFLFLFNCENLINVSSIQDNRADTVFYDNGQVQKITPYKDGKQHGYAFTYNSDGSIYSLSCYQNDSLYIILTTCIIGTGTDTLRDLRDSIILIYSYQNSSLQGLYTSYWPNGILGETQNYKNGERHGLNFKYYLDGRIIDLDCYQNGNNNSLNLSGCITGTGIDTLRDLRDSIYIIYSYQNDSLQGLFTEYGIDGSINDLDCYQNSDNNGLNLSGCITGTGIDTLRDLKDSIYIIYSYQNDNLQGLFTEYRTDGSISDLDCYQNGNNNGLNLSSCITGTGTDTLRDLRDSIYIIYSYQNDGLQLTTEYRTDGSIWSRTNYKDEKRHGYKINYHSDGTLFQVSCFDNGRRTKGATAEQEQQFLADSTVFLCP